VPETAAREVGLQQMELTGCGCGRVAWHGWALLARLEEGEIPEFASEKRWIL